MQNSSVPPFANRASALHVWLRLTLAIFVLALYTAIALSSGVAHADGGPSASAGETGATGATGAPASQQPGATGAAAAQQSGATNPATGAATGPKSSPPSHVGAGRPTSTTSVTAGTAPKASAPASAQPSQRHDPNRSSAGDTPKTAGTTGTTEPSDAKDPPKSNPIGAAAQAKTAATADPAAPATSTVPTSTVPMATVPMATVPGDVPAAVDTAAPDAAPVPALPTDVLQNLMQSGPLALVRAPASAEPRPAATVGPSLRSFGPTVGAKQPTSNVAAIAPSNPGPSNTAPTNTTPLIQPNLGLELAGLVSDVGTLAVSVVHTVATTVAQAFGPDSFLGAPYLLATLVANTAAAVGLSIVGGPVMGLPMGPFAVNYGILNGLAFFNPTIPPAGANDPSIMVTSEHPLPIILINGTIATQGENFSVAAPVLANAGYKVYSFNYGNITSDPNYPIQSTADIRQSGLELAAEVDRVLAATPGADKVILIGHSQGGGILPVYYINNLGGADKVSQLIGIAPSNHGTDVDGLIALQSLPIFGQLLTALANALGPALEQQAVGSPFQQEVYGNGDTRPGVLYTTITSVNDEVVTPYTQQALVGPNVTNIILQDRYPGLVNGHINIITSPATFAAVLEALASNPAANPLQNPSMVAA